MFLFLLVIRDRNINRITNNIKQLLKELQNTCGVQPVDDAAVIAVLDSIKKQRGDSNRAVLAKKIDVCTILVLLVKERMLIDLSEDENNNNQVLVSLCRGVKVAEGKFDFKYSLKVVSAAVDTIASLARDGKDTLIKTGGVKALYVSLSRAYPISLHGGTEASAAKEVVEKLLNLLDSVCAFDEALVVLPFDCPPEAAAAAQLTELKTFGSITMLLRSTHGFSHKRSKILGIISSVTALRKGAALIASTSTSEENAVDNLLFFAAKGDSRIEYKKASSCICNLIRHVAAVRQRVLSTEDGVTGLANIPRLRDQFIEILDGGCIGYPPRTHAGTQRDAAAVKSALDALEYLLDNRDSRNLTIEALLDSNERGLLALFGIGARLEDTPLRRRSIDFISMLSESSPECDKYVQLMKDYSGTGEMVSRWGTGFRFRQEYVQREQREADRQKNMQQKQQMQMQQMQMMGGMPGMGGMGGDPMGGMGMPGGGPESQAEAMQQLQAMMAMGMVPPGMGGPELEALMQQYGQ